MKWQQLTAALLLLRIGKLHRPICRHCHIISHWANCWSKVWQLPILFTSCMCSSEDCCRCHCTHVLLSCAGEHYVPMTVEDIKRDQAKANAPAADTSSSVAAPEEPSGTLQANAGCCKIVRGMMRCTRVATPW